MKGKFIVLEGGDGCGKTVQLRRLEQTLRSLHVPILATEQPGGTAIGQRIREIILKEPIADVTELLLYASDRAEHVATVIKPALAEGRVVLCSRYVYSTLAYQHYGRGLDRNVIDGLNWIATGGLMPDLTIWLDIPPEMGLSRAKGRDVLDRLEKCDLEFHYRIWQCYQELFLKRDRIARVDASQTENEVFGELMDLVEGAIARTNR